MPDTTTSDLTTGGGAKPMTAAGIKLLPTDGIVVVDPHAKWIASGKKKILIKSRPFKISGMDLLLITRSKALGIIKLSAPKLIGLKEFKDLEPLHLIDEPTRKKFWPGYREWWAYKVLMMKVFAEPIGIKPLVGPLVIARGIELQIEKSPSMFDLEKAEGQAIPNFGAWLAVLSGLAAKWSKSTLRFIDGPAALVETVRMFPKMLSELCGCFSDKGGEADPKASFPTALEEASKWAVRAARALEGTGKDDFVLAAKNAAKIFEKIQAIVENMDRIEDGSKLKANES